MPGTVQLNEPSHSILRVSVDVVFLMGNLKGDVRYLIDHTVGNVCRTLIISQYFPFFPISCCWLF